MGHGAVVGLFVSAAAAGRMRAVDQAEAVPGRGLAGDRYADGAGTWSSSRGPQRQVTLIEVEAIEAAHRDYGVGLEPADTRRNILTSGVALNHLVGRAFRVGQATLRGVKLCEPCGHMERLCARPGAARADPPRRPQCRGGRRRRDPRW